MAKAKPITGLDIHASTGKNARIIARARLADMYSWAKYVDDPQHIQELHNLRIAAKRVRYTLEIFAEVLPEACAAILRELEQLQEELGGLHDSDVMIELLHLCSCNQECEESEIVDKSTSQEQVEVNPELVPYLTNPTFKPSIQEQQGLELFLLGLQNQREEQYMTFRQHWDQLQERDFRCEILNLLDI